MEKTLPIRGKQVYLSDPTEDDLETLRQWFLSSDPARLTCRPLRDHSKEEVRRRFRERAQSANSRVFAVRRCADDKLVGRVTWFDLNTRNRSVEIGFLTGPDYRRNGYTSEAVRLLLAHLFDDSNINKVMAQTGEFNEVSIALLTSLGFTVDGRLRQHHVIDGTYYDDLIFSILAEEFGEKG